MKLKIYTLGTGTHSFIREGEGEYLKRLSRWIKVEIVELDNGAWAERQPEEQQRRDWELLQKKLKKAERLYLLDERGVQLSSQKFADLLRKDFDSGISLAFAIGGSHGWDDTARKGAAKLLSLSALTFTHQMARLLLLEQIYRGFTIINGLPYHK